MHYSPSFREAFRFWLKLGMISFGGPAGQIAIMQRELVEKRRWISGEDFLHALNFCMLLPGPEAQQLATYLGWRLHGIRGGIIAGSFFIIPSIFFLMMLSYLYARFGSIDSVAAVLLGFKAVVVAIVIEALLKISRRAFKNATDFAIAILSFAAIYFFAIPFPLIIAAAAVVGLIFFRSKKSEIVKADAPLNHFHTLRIFLVCLFLWFVPFVFVIMFAGKPSVAAKTYLFFTQSAFVTFGGAYAVLAYVNQSVVSAGWITSAQSIDGLALAETTPGPLIMVLQFIGFMSGWNNSDGFDRTTYAIACALIATYVTFLPSFLFILAGAPYIERLRTNTKLTSALSGVTAAVVGVIANLALVFGGAVIFHAQYFDIFAFALALASFVALYFFNTNVIVVVIIGGLFGLAKFLLLG
jgi:chromate transporter